jgi:hypothetical protein
MSTTTGPLPSKVQLVERARHLLKKLDQEDMGYSEYDAAWVARVPKRGSPQREPAFPTLLQTVRDTQRADGGWGPEQVDYVSSRILATLASVLALTEFEGHQELDKAKRGVAYVLEAWQRLDKEPDLTIGFELVAYPLTVDVFKRVKKLAERWEPQEQRRLEQLPELEALQAQAKVLFDEKLSGLPNKVAYWSELSLAFSLEFLHDKLDAKEARQLLSRPSNTITSSVAATAYYVIKSGDEEAYKALEQLVGRGNLENISYAVNTRLWESIWTLHNLHVAGLTDELEKECRPHLHFIHEQIGTHGLAWSTEVAYGDSDDSAVAFKVLHDFQERYGINYEKLKWSLLEQYEKPDGFVGFLAERGPSVSANAHVLEAIQHDGQLTANHPRGEEWRDKAAQILLRQRWSKGYWTDKWQVSPYYPTSCAVKALLDWKPSSAFRSIQWMRDTQRSDGGWGWFERSSPEETAYSLHVLTMSQMKHLKFQKELDAVKDMRELDELTVVKDLEKKTSERLERDLHALKNLKALRALEARQEQKSFVSNLRPDDRKAMEDLEKVLNPAAPSPLWTKVRPHLPESCLTLLLLGLAAVEIAALPLDDLLRAFGQQNILIGGVLTILARQVLMSRARVVLLRMVLYVLGFKLLRSWLTRHMLKYRERLEYMRRWKEPATHELLVKELDEQKDLLRRVRGAESLEAAKQLLQSEYLAHLKVDPGIIERGAAYLAQFDGTEPGDTHPKLWIAKVLYRPRNVVRATIIAALTMCVKVKELEAERPTDSRKPTGAAA